MNYHYGLPVRWRIISLAFFSMLAGIFTAPAHALPSYSFGVETGTYKELEGATSTTIAPGDTLLHVLDLGNDAFKFFKQPYRLNGERGLEISGYGFVRLWTDTSVVVVDGYFMELARRDETSSISYLIEGEPGNRVLKVQWKNAGFPEGLASDYINFQIWLYQQSGTIELRIGPNRVEGPNAYKGGGPWLGAFTSPSSFSGMTEKCWITGDPANPVFDTKRTFEFKRLNGTPAAGTIYRLTPTTGSSVPAKPDEAYNLDLHPNPAGDYVLLAPEATLHSGATLRITDLLGTKLIDRDLKAGERRVDLAGLPDGVYIVELHDRRGRYVGKLLKQESGEM